MIHIERTTAPDFFNSEKVMIARDELRKRFENTEQQERFRFDTSLLSPVKSDLLEMCNGKCAYCESKIEVTSFGDIDNFRPKGGARGFNNKEYAPMHYWWLAYEWENLLYSCQICNQKYKRDFFPLENESKRARIGAIGIELLDENALLIDPCNDNPDEHLQFDKTGFVNSKTKKGKVTIEILGLNRKELVERRIETANVLIMNFELLRNKNKISPALILELVNYVKELFSDHPTQEYVAMQRAVFNAWYETASSIWDKLKSFSISGLTQSIKSLKRAVEQSDIDISIESNIDKSNRVKIAASFENNKVERQLSSIKRFSIKTIEIENFKSIEKVCLNLMPVNEKELQESWLLLLGDNGIGKSSILQAVALALAGKKQLARLKIDVTDYLKRGSANGKVVIQGFELNDPIELYFDQNGFRTELEEPPTFILAYGSTRLLPKGRIKPDRSKEPYLNIKNLFDYSVALNDPNEWLNRIDTKEFNERVAPAFFDVLALKGDDRMWVNEGKINIHQYGEDTELEDNSDGYKTITALVSDIMQTLSVDRANYHNAQGIVLIDEIGNHLHPRWRMKIAGALRKAFPKLQFIVTTHEPLCLRGLSHGEVVVLVRDQKNVIRALDKELLPDHSMMRIEQLLTSDLFGLINVMDDQTEKTYEEYYKLLSKQEKDKTAADLVQIEELSSKLAGKEILGNTPQEQAFYKVIDETYAQKLRQEGFKTKEELKKETISEVKEMIKKQNPGWL
jgi:uncharacterized protein (TIGR02646 family)